MPGDPATDSEPQRASATLIPITEPTPRIAIDRAPHGRAASRWWAVAIVLVLLLSRWPIAHTALQGSELSTDEADLTMMAVDRFYGIPLTNTHWPGLTNQALMVPIVGVDFLLSAAPRSVSGFAAYSGGVYRDGSHLVYVHRWVVITLCVGAIGVLAATLLRTRFADGTRIDPRAGLALACLAAAVLQTQHLVTFTSQGLSNGPAMAMLTLMFACCLSRLAPPRKAFLAGLVLGAALLARNTSILALPLLVGFALQQGEHWRGGIRWLGLAFLGFVLGAMPLAYAAAVEPVRWVKGNVGNFVKVGQGAGLGESMSAILDGIGWPLAITVFAAVVLLAIRRQQLWFVAAWLFALTFGWVIASRSPFVSPHYFDALTTGAGIVAVLGARSLLASASPEQRTRTIAAISVVAVVIGCSGWWSSYQRFLRSRQGLRPTDRAVAALVQAPAGQRVVIDQMLLPPLKPRVTSAALREIGDRTEAAMQRGEAVREYVARFRLSPEVADVFAANLTEKEKSDIVRSRICAAAPPTGEAVDVIVAAHTVDGGRYGRVPATEVPALLRSGGAAVAVVTRESLQTWSGSDVAQCEVEPLLDGKYVRVRWKSVGR